MGLFMTVTNCRDSFDPKDNAQVSVSGMHIPTHPLIYTQMKRKSVSYHQYLAFGLMNCVIAMEATESKQG